MENGLSIFLKQPVIRSLLKNEVAECSHGNQLRDFLYVKDVADAFVALLDSETMGAVNIASGEAKTIREVVGTIADLPGKSEKLCLGAIPVAGYDPKRIVADVHRLNGEIDWTPKYTLVRGLRRQQSLKKVASNRSNQPY